MTLVPGTRIASYEITSAIGEGGMGEVYRARDTRLKRDVALKILASSVASDRDRIARFQREAELLAALNHPNIAHIHGVEETGGSLAIVMELVEGEDLTARIARGPLPIDEALPVARQIAAALEAAHERGIIHRDLKPANIKVRADGTVKVLDFGLARAAPASSSALGPAGSAVSNSPTITSPAMTAAGLILGTAAYMSPEQARGKVVDKRADVWAFGAVFFEMITGRRAFPGDDVSDVIASVLARDPDWSLIPAGLTPAQLQCLKRCLERDPRRRVRDMGDVLLALEGAFDPQPAAAPATAFPRAPWRRVVPIAAAAVAGAAATAVLMPIRGPAPAPPAVSRLEVPLPPGQELRTAQRSLIAVAPLGDAFAYMAMDGIRVRAIGDLEPRVIPGTFEPDGPAYAPGSFAAPFFSPDGKWIGFFARDGLKKIGIAGGTPVPIHASPSPAVSYAATTCGASWSADNTILFGQAGGIMRIPADGGIPELIVPAGKDEQLCRPQVLPGGDAVLFTVMKVGSGPVSDGDIAAHSLASGKRSVIVRGGVDARYLPDGYLVYGVRNTLMAVAFDPGRAALTGDAVSIAQGVQRPFGLNAAGIHFAVSDRGTLIYLAENPQKRSLRWVNRDRTPADPIDAVPPGALQDPRLSPDGGRVLVTRDLDIWIYELASGRASRITNDGHSQMAVWDPTGTRVAFSTINGSDAEAWIAPADGSAAPRQLTDKGGQVHVDAWSPDGRTISVHRHAPSSRAVTILMISVDGPQQPVAFAERDSPAESVCFARDGRYVAYTAAETGQREIYIRPYPGPGGRITVSANGGTEPRWAANGEVFYRNAAGDRMFSVSTSTTPTLTVGRPSLVFQDAYFIAPSGSPRAQYDVTADGKRFLMVTSAPDGDGGRSRFVVVQNWLDELKSRARSGTPAPGR